LLKNYTRNEGRSKAAASNTTRVDCHSQQTTQKAKRPQDCRPGAIHPSRK